MGNLATRSSEQYKWGFKICFSLMSFRASWDISVPVCCSVRTEDEFSMRCGKKSKWGSKLWPEYLNVQSHECSRAAGRETVSAKQHQCEVAAAAVSRCRATRINAVYLLYPTTQR